jgi:hypothetical protein
MFSQILTFVTIGDILRYIRYIAGEDVMVLKLPGSFFVYIWDLIQVVEGRRPQVQHLS